MAKPKPRKKQVVLVDEREQFELISYLPEPPKGSRIQKNLPYLKSFAADKHPRIIGDSILKYTACSTKQWRAPEDRLPKRVFA